MKKTVFTILCMVLIIMGCGKKDSNSGGGSIGGENFGKKDPASYSATLNMWAHSPGQPTYFIQEFNKIYPNIKINLTIIPAAEQQQKIMNAVAARSNVPDVFTARTQFVRLLVEADGFYADLLSPPYNATHLAQEIEPYVIGVGTDETGALRALSWQCPVGGIFYRRSLARQFWGNDDPGFISEKFATYDKLLDTAREIKNLSGGKVKFITHYQQLAPLIRSGGENGFVKDGALYFDPAIDRLFELSKIFFDEDLDVKIMENTPNQYAAMANGQLFAFVYPTWGLNYNIMTNHPDTVGDWGLAAGPNSYTYGGTYFGIYERTKYPEEAYLFVNFVMSNLDFIRGYALSQGDYVSNRKIQQELGAMGPDQTKDFSTFQFMNNQNIYRFFNDELAKGVNAAIFSKYDELFITYLNNACQQYAEGFKAKEAALKQFKDDCANAVPNLIIN
ncbi:MAG: extracellular solute-binding protein [Treponema sp.]|jgi:ABC-type glycerol-3-phosphate transport system substrate-binding protein|nr:extracellular solute-binding protein [Treponema sp.]